MTVQITEITKEDRETFGQRLQQLREDKGLTRRDVSELTGIPFRSIEKYEYGTMSPNVERLQALVTNLDTSTNYLLKGELATTPPELVAPSILPANDNRFEDLGDQFETLDNMRKEGFQNSWRSAPRLLAEVQQTVGELPYDALLDLGEKRKILVVPEDNIDGFDELLPEDQEVTALDIAKRVMDTAYFGVDLFKLALSPLEQFAERLELQPDQEGWFGYSWSGSRALIEALRPHLREQAVRGKVPIFEDEDSFKRIEVA